MSILKNEQVQLVYRQLLREARKFPQYNYRMYALRKIKDEFKECDKAMAASAGEQNVSNVINRAKEELERLKRMTKVASLYSFSSSILEADQENQSK